MTREAISKEFWLWQHTSGSLGARTAGANVSEHALLEDGSREQGARLRQIRWNLEWEGKTNTEGPIWFGLSWNTVAALVTESINSDPQSDNDEEAMEEIRRKVVILGMIPARSTQSGETTNFRYTAPLTFRTKKLPSWDLDEGSHLRLWFGVPTGGVNVATGTLFTFDCAIKQGWLSD